MSCIRKSYILLVVAIVLATSHICAATIPTISRTEADSLERTVVMWNGRACPYGSMAHDVVLKLYGSSHCYSYSPSQVVASWQKHPEVWNRAPVIIVKDKRIREAIGMTGSHTSLSYLLDHRSEIQQLWNKENNQHSKLAQALLETDERATIALMIADGGLYEIPAKDDDDAKLTDCHISAELLLVSIPFTTILFIANLTLGLIFMVAFIIHHSTRPLPTSTKGKGFTSNWGSFVCGLISLLFLLFVFFLRWYVQGYIPLTNGYETMLVWAIALQAVMLPLSLKHRLLMPFAFLLPGFTLLVAHLGEMSPQLTPLMPALHSPWLSSHVSVIMISYALLTITFILSVIALLSKKDSNQREWLTHLGHQLLLPAVLLLLTGIVLGSIWAKTAWGAYWSWDPKETWALITLIVYVIPLAVRPIHLMKSHTIYNIYIMCAFASVLMTYFGVNYFLGGMHSYAGD